MKKLQKGFTLIELLIVITIISIIMGMIVIASRSVTVKALIENTRGTIMVLDMGLAEYYAIFRIYPDVSDGATFSAATNGYDGADAGNDIGSIGNTQFQQMNKRLTFVLTGRRVSNDPEFDGEVLVQQKIPIKDDGDKEFVVDAWGNFLRICPGRDHSATGNIPQGPNNLNATERNFYKPDVYSIGNDQKDTVGGDFDKTAYNSDTGDDIVSWFIEKTKKGN